MPFPFLKLPDVVRNHIYSYLGFQAEAHITLFADKHQKPANAIQVRQSYNVDFNRSGQLSQPWTRNGRDNLRVTLPMMLVNQEICDELYTLLYSNCVFMVHLQGIGCITHLTLSYNIHAKSAEHHLLLFNQSDAKEALVAAIGAVTALTPNLVYFGINFWSPGLKSLFPNFSFDAQPDWMTIPEIDASPSPSVSPIRYPDGFFEWLSKNRTKTMGRPRPKQNRTFPVSTTETNLLKTPIEFQYFWLLPAVNALINKGTIKTFALLKDGKGCGVLDWNREKKNITKGISRDLMRGIAKVLN
ncbi:hypothetical protein EG327_008131 [Venturia inaequalis]|uniref:Uncharacterized protein n=1 Tax=Venturia inaequalis TaxID=5025 RepID=A0A8H3VQJ5_VENIN|nr:hypothetical protein EG327_008131 [Venturia inaequalis]